MKRILVAPLIAIALLSSACTVKQVSTGLAVTAGIAAASVEEINTAGVDPIQIEDPEKLQRITLTCQSILAAFAISGKAPANITTDGMELCNLAVQAAKPVDASNELSKD
jgi:hypothetical protein